MCVLHCAATLVSRDATLLDKLSKHFEKTMLTVYIALYCRLTHVRRIKCYPYTQISTHVVHTKVGFAYTRFDTVIDSLNSTSMLVDTYPVSVCEGGQHIQMGEGAPQERGSTVSEDTHVYSSSSTVAILQSGTQSQ